MKDGMYIVVTLVALLGVILYVTAESPRQSRVHGC